MVDSFLKGFLIDFEGFACSFFLKLIKNDLTQDCETSLFFRFIHRFICGKGREVQIREHGIRMTLHRFNYYASETTAAYLYLYFDEKRKARSLNERKKIDGQRVE